MSNIFILCQTHFPGIAKLILGGFASPLVTGLGITVTTQPEPHKFSLIITSAGLTIVAHAAIATGPSVLFITLYIRFFQSKSAFC